MKILILGDVMGSSGRKAIQEKLSKIIKKNQIDFTKITFGINKKQQIILKKKLDF